MSKTKVTLSGKTILVSGSPGFVGANLVMRLLSDMAGGTVVSLDNMNDYYDVSLKEWRLKQIEKCAAGSPVKHVFVKGSIGDKALVDGLFRGIASISPSTWRRKRECGIPSITPTCISSPTSSGSITY